MTIKARPDGFQSVTPYLQVRGAERLIAFLTKVFAAEVRSQFKDENGRLMHTEIQIGDSLIEMGDVENTEYIATISAIRLYVDNTDAYYQRAVEAGATPFSPPKDAAYGEREAGFIDPAGNYWYLSTPLSATNS